MPRNTPNAREAEASADNSTAPGVDQPDQEAINTADDPNMPAPVASESEDETADRHVASTELPVEDVTDPGTQADTPMADEAKPLVVPGAAAGPDAAGTVLNDHGKVAYAPPGSYNAAVNGVQQDASGHVDSVGTDNSHLSGTRA